MNGVNAEQGPLQIRAQCLVGVIEAGPDGALCQRAPCSEVPAVVDRYQEPYLFALSAISSHEVIYLDTRG